MSTPSLQSQGYLPVATATLSPATVVDCELFIQHPGRKFAELYKGRNYPLRDQDLDSLRQEGVDHLYIRLQDSEAYRAYLCEHVLCDSTVSKATRMRALRDVTRVAFHDAFLASDCNNLVQVASDFGHDLATVLADQAPAFPELFKTLEHDYYTFTHACNVSTYCAMLAIRLELCSRAEVAELATGALLHDIGKRHIPPHVLQKAGKLTDAEWELVQAHPITGFRELQARGDMSWGQLMMVYQHHERLDGSGYPAGLLADEIHPWAQICAVADVFDAMSCARPYRRAVPMNQICEHFTKHVGARYHAGAVECLTAQLLASGANPAAAVS
jgi:HD-GYP domain-containing protein (c-di-GMP phosphodiesterase class II)